MMNMVFFVMTTPTTIVSTICWTEVSGWHHNFSRQSKLCTTHELRARVVSHFHSKRRRGIHNHGLNKHMASLR